MPAILVIDSGTTTTRVRTIVDGEITWEGTAEAGARNTAMDNSNQRIRAALSELIRQARGATGDSVEAAVCSGMITSNMGLLEVPHILAPASDQEIASSIVRKDFEDITDLPMVFVPGVKTIPNSLGLGNLNEGDVLRGEECECRGLRELGVIRGAATLLHFGSHHKAIDVAPDGAIQASRTGITGELLSAVSEHTILKSSVDSPHMTRLDDSYVDAGIRDCREHGIIRALFLVRVGEQLANLGRKQMTSYLIGVLAYSDCALVGPPNAGRQLVLYGKGPFPKVLGRTLANEGHNVQLVDEARADHAAAMGAAAFYRQARQRLVGSA